jgi:Uma2 family endonuclease
MVMPLTLPVYTLEMLREFPDDGNRYELLEGFLIVTPAPAPPHQIVATRLANAIGPYLASAGLAHVVCGGEIERAPKTHLEPDLLVFPASGSPARGWNAFRDWWLAVEVFSPSSRMYDRNYKRDAYLALGVREVWLVDVRAGEVLVSRSGGPVDEPVRDRLEWSPAGMPAPLSIELTRVFDGVD